MTADKFPRKKKVINLKVEKILQLKKEHGAVKVNTPQPVT